MKLTIPYHKLSILICVCFSLLITSCSSLIKGYVNRKYPPVSSVAKSTAAVEESIQQMQGLTHVDLGAKISKTYMDTIFHNYFAQMLAKDSSLGIGGISSIQVIQYPELSLGRQELILTSTLKFNLSGNKYVKYVQVNFSGRIAPSIIEDSLILRPSFQRINIQQLKLTKCLFLGSAAKLAVNALCQSFMDNINGQIKNINIKINYPPLPEKSISSILGNDANISVKNDYVFKLKHQMVTPVLLVEPKNVLLIASIADNTDTTSNTTAQANGQAIDKSLLMPQPDYVVSRSGKMKFLNGGAANASSNNAPPTFDELYNYADSSFRNSWSVNLDSINYADSSSVAVHISYNAMSRIVNELFTGVKFSMTYNVNINKNFPQKDISLGEIQKPDCSQIQFNCPTTNCSTVLSDCGGCSWWDALCWGRVAACQALNGLKYSACQLANGAKLTLCATEFAAEKALCYTEVAGIFIYDNLIKPVGTFGGNASVTGQVTGEIDATAPGGINSLGLTGQLQADINGAGNINFTPSGLLGLLVCNLPTAAAFNVNVHVANPAFNLNATIQKLTNANGPYLNVSMNKLTVPLQLQEPFIVEILKNPQLILNCGIGIITGLSYLALKDNDTFNKFLQVAFTGNYDLEIQRDFNITIPTIPIQVLQSQIVLNPAWGTRSLVFNNSK